MLKILATALVSATLLIAPVITTATPAEAVVKKATCDIAAPASAHRGNWDDRKYPENSRNGFRYAQDKGVKYWETDVRFKADGTAVIHHDDANLATMTLDEFLNDLQVDYNVTAMIEFKEDPADHWTDIIGMVNHYGVASRIIWTSFEASYLLEAQVQTPSIPRGLIQTVGDTTAAVIAAAHVQWFIKYSDSITYGRLQTWLAGANSTIKVAPWADKLDNNPTEWDRMNSYSQVALMIINTPGSYATWATSYC